MVVYHFNHHNKSVFHFYFNDLAMLPKKPSLTTSFQVQGATGAYATKTFWVTITAPVVSSMAQISTKVSSWNKISNSLQNGDSNKMVFNTATISRTSQLMIVTQKVFVA